MLQKSKFLKQGKLASLLIKFHFPDPVNGSGNVGLGSVDPYRDWRSFSRSHTRETALGFNLVETASCFARV